MIYKPNNAITVQALNKWGWYNVYNMKSTKISKKIANEKNAMRWKVFENSVSTISENKWAQIFYDFIPETCHYYEWSEIHKFAKE